MNNIKLCRLKKAFIIFWAVLTRRNYLFASSRHSYDSKKNINFLISVPAEHSCVFLENTAECIRERLYGGNITTYSDKYELCPSCWKEGEHEKEYNNTINTSASTENL